MHRGQQQVGRRAVNLLARVASGQRRGDTGEGTLLVPCDVCRWNMGVVDMARLPRIHISARSPARSRYHGIPVACLSEVVWLLARTVPPTLDALLRHRRSQCPLPPHHPPQPAQARPRSLPLPLPPPPPLPPSTASTRPSNTSTRTRRRPADTHRRPPHPHPHPHSHRRHSTTPPT